MSRKDDRITELEATLLDEFSLVVEQERTIEGLAMESDDRAREIDRLHAAIEAVVEDMRNLQEVPAGDLFQSIGEIVGTLRAVIV